MAETETETLMERHRQEALERRQALQPMVDEANQLDDYLTSFSGGTRRRSAARSRSGGGSNASTGTRRRRSNGGPNRHEQFLAVVEKSPGSTISEIATEINANLGSGERPVTANYLYRVRDALMETGHVAAEGDGFKATGKKLDE